MNFQTLWNILWEKGAWGEKCHFQVAKNQGEQSKLMNKIMFLHTLDNSSQPTAPLDQTHLAPWCKIVYFKSQNTKFECNIWTSYENRKLRLAPWELAWNFSSK